MMDANNSAQRSDAFDQGPIERVHEGMRVFDSAGQEIGKVELIRMGDPTAATAQGESHSTKTPGVDDMAQRVPIIGVGDEDLGPELPEPGRSRMLRMGFIKVEGGGFLGIGAQERYARADQIADVAGDRVILGVPVDDLPREHDSRNPLDA